jgi:syntaxin 5
MGDRTQEFLEFANQLQAIKEAVESRSSSTTLKNGNKQFNDRNQEEKEVPKTRSAFNEAAGDIGKGIHRTAGMLKKLTGLVRRQGLFDDATDEINKLIFSIKNDLDELNSKSDSAQQYIQSKKNMFGSRDQSVEHNVKVVSHLKTDLMHTTKDFKTVLELRSSKMKDQQARKFEIIGKGVLSPTKLIDSATMENMERKRRANDAASSGSRCSNGGNNHAINSAMVPSKPKFVSPYNNDNLTNNGQFSSQYGHSSDQMETQLLLDPVAENQYFDAREKAVTEVEQTIGELGQLFKRLAMMISEQAELVERIDEDIEAANSNADRAHTMLIQTYESVSSNRGMYMKIGVIIALFLLGFIVFLL